MIDSDCVDVIDRLELDRRNFGRKDIRAASTTDEGVGGHSSGNVFDFEEAVANEADICGIFGIAGSTIVDDVFKIAYIASLSETESVFEQWICSSTFMN